MIEAIIKYNGVLVDKPRFATIVFNENDIAFERMNETTKKTEKITVGQLYNRWKRPGTYVQDGPDPDDHISPNWFLNWFSVKYIQGKPIQHQVIDMQFKVT